LKFVYRFVSKLAFGRPRIRRFALLSNTFLSKLQTSKEISFYSHTLRIPSRHPLPVLHKSPFRDLSLRIASRHVFRAERNHYIDIGANIGDTASVIESCAAPKTKVHGTLVEPSEFFMGYLKHNAQQLNNPILLKMFASTQFPSAPIHGTFHHWTGNAEVVQVGQEVIADLDSQVNLATLIREETALVKIDCEGLDVAILTAMFQHGLDHFPVLYFENPIGNYEDLEKFSNLFTLLAEHYSNVLVSDPDGKPIYVGALNNSCLDLSSYQLAKNSLDAGSLPYLDMMVFPKDSQDFVTIQQEVRSFRIA